jgi:hypothetical protein
MSVEFLYMYQVLQEIYWLVGDGDEDFFKAYA